jgi:hypothetical protein
LTAPYIDELAVYYDDFSASWLSQFLALRDISQFWVGASLQYMSNREQHDAGLQSACAESRNAILNALNNMSMPSNFTQTDVVSVFGETFRLILPDTPHLAGWDAVEHIIDDYQALDALDSFATKLSERQIIHRVSDREVMRSVSQVISNILQEDPGSQYRGPRPGLYVTNCPECHLAGENQLRFSGLQLPVCTLLTTWAAEPFMVQMRPLSWNNLH